MTLVRGTRLIAGTEAIDRRKLLTKLQACAIAAGFTEVVLPSLEFAELYTDKAGAEILGQMYTFPDKADRMLCLRPEGTATLQQYAVTNAKKDQAYWYETRCWRYERPQAGRYREFTQFGIEILWPTKDYTATLIALATKMVAMVTPKFEVKQSVKRGLAYYTQGQGFEIVCPTLGAQQQVVGGGAYAEGIGFALGVDRLLLASEDV